MLTQTLQRNFWQTYERTLCIILVLFVTLLNFGVNSIADLLARNCFDTSHLVYNPNNTALFFAGVTAMACDIGDESEAGTLGGHLQPAKREEPTPTTNSWIGQRYGRSLGGAHRTNGCDLIHICMRLKINLIKHYNFVREFIFLAN